MVVSVVRVIRCNTLQADRPTRSQDSVRRRRAIVSDPVRRWLGLRQLNAAKHVHLDPVSGPRTKDRLVLHFLDSGGPRHPQTCLLCWAYVKRRASILYSRWTDIKPHNQPMYSVL